MAHAAARAVCCKVGPRAFLSLHSWQRNQSDHRSCKYQMAYLPKLAPHQAKLAHWCISMAEFDFSIKHHPGTINAVPDALSHQPMLDLPIDEDSCSPEEGVTSSLLLALSADVLHHTPSLVSETLNGTLAYLCHVCLLTHTTVHHAASKRVEA